jgi:hypothetical protein
VIDAARTLFGEREPHVISVSPGGELMPWEDRPACAGELRVLLTHAPGKDVHDAITAAFAEDRPLADRVGLNPPYAWSTATVAAQLDTADARRRSERNHPDDRMASGAADPGRQRAADRPHPKVVARPSSGSAVPARRRCAGSAATASGWFASGVPDH